MRFCVPIAAVVLSVLALGCSDAEPRSFELSPSSLAGDTPAATATVPGPPSMPATSSTSTVIVTTPTPMVSTPAPPLVCEAFPRPSRELVPDSEDALQSQLGIDVLRPLLPHFIRGLVTSSGEAVDIAIGVPQSRQGGSTALEIDPVSLFPDLTTDDELPARVQTFREAAAAAFAWITSQGVCVGDLYVYWRSGGGGTGAQSNGFQQWLIPGDRFPEVLCSADACEFVRPPTVP